MVEWFLSQLPDYTPPVFDMTTVVDGVSIVDSVIPSGLAGVDWGYLLSGVFIIVCIYCFFKILGGVLCHLF